MKRMLASLLAMLFLGSGLVNSVYAEMPNTQNLNTNKIDISTDEIKEYDGFLVGMRERLDIHFFSEQHSELRSAVLEQVINGIYWVNSLQVVQELKRLGLIEFFEPNYYVTLFDDSGNNSNGWPYDTLMVEYADSYNLKGSGVRIGIIDSGVDSSNPDLQNANLQQGYNYVEENTDTRDDVSHGTKVTQVICGDHNGLGIGGIAPNTEIIPLKCFSSSGGGTIRIIIQAIQDAVDRYQCDIINMSWGLNSNSQALYSMLRYAYDAGSILVAAAGNVSSSYPQGTMIYPAAYNEVFSVSAIDSSLHVLSSSQKNDQVYLCAPGGSIPFVDENGNVTYDSGTSFAAPFITATIAVLMELDADLDQKTIQQIMEARAVDLGEPGYDTAYGYGMLPMHKLLGQHWSRFYTTEQEGHTSKSVSGWTLNHGGSKVIMAAFDKTGQMKGAQILSVDGDRGLFHHVFPDETASWYQVVYTDTDFIPLTECDLFYP